MYRECLHVYVDDRIYFIGLMVTWDAHEEGRGINFSLEWVKMAEALIQKKEKRISIILSPLQM